MTKTSIPTHDARRLDGVKARSWRLAVATLAVTLLLAPLVAAQESPDEEEGPLDVLEKLAGTWLLTSRPFPEKTERPEITGERTIASPAKVEREMILGGTVLREQVSGAEQDAEGEPVFQGLGLTGYDETRGTYWRTWADNQSSGVLVMYGTRDDDVITFHGELRQREVRSTLRLTTLARQDVEWYEIHDGRETKTMHLVYKGGPFTEFVTLIGRDGCCDDGDCESGLSCTEPAPARCTGFKGTCQ